MDTAGSAFLRDALRTFRGYKTRTEKAFAQLQPQDWFQQIDPEANSIAVIVKHMAGNMRSRWTDFLSSDGEKPNRNRDSEFILDASTTPDRVLEWWQEGWTKVFAAIEPLQSADLEKKVTIAGHEHTVLEAINRQLTHYAEHVGQIIFLAKHFRGSEWKTLSIPKGQSVTATDALERRRLMERA
ncbi:MAG: DUF1572 family protein [Acidobacteria bacterium]|nr:DUF1572 family protein [Acidobacteriota bacterium]